MLLPGSHLHRTSVRMDSSRKPVSYQLVLHHRDCRADELLQRWSEDDINVSERQPTCGSSSMH
eukprot:7026296-Prymnesium_polylepis.1